MWKKSTFLFVCVVSVNILGILSFPKDDWKDEYHKAKGRSWGYGTKIEHPAPKHGYHHKGSDYHSNDFHSKGEGKGWTKISDHGDKHYEGGHYERPEIPLELKVSHNIPHIPIHIPPISTIPIQITKYDNYLGHDYQPKHHYEPRHYPIHKHVNIHYVPKREEPKKDSLDINVNVDGIIDDINREVSKTSNYVS